QQCREPLTEGQLSIKAERAGPNKIWHAHCFVCGVCRELLIDWNYFFQDGVIYCGRHHAELLKPRCAGCDEVGRNIIIIITIRRNIIIIITISHN
ncbi:hypothetical protein HELRODRAFT_91037, partial [Helobdella robusta]|uniref:LIM zinc-binding domain-containing protein n=1 Tax=Helobdella robusta TaxID=6412 RepID=T1G7Y9_HELRO